MMAAITHLLALISLLTLIFFYAVVRIKKGAPLEAFSEAAYIVKDTSLFTSVIVLCSALLTVRMIILSTPGTGLLAMVFLFGMIAVGASPHYRRAAHTLHMAGAITAGVASQLLIGLNDYRLLALWIPYAIYYIVMRKRSMLLEEKTCLLVIAWYCLL